MQDSIRYRDLVRYRAMESLCRQRAVFHPLDSWQLLAEAEMWHHKALAAMSSGALARGGAAPTATIAQAVSRASDTTRWS
ncbi:hypothetical protein [Bradyrhizobium sp.]|jgi:hypothetical protein|uniref:hypothetical protein n=1 Tax=Bradyrhizobium sp. TaxID=376 RepID=UPI003C1BC2C2